MLLWAVLGLSSAIAGALVLALAPSTPGDVGGG
jgi:hypothetical protein